MKFLQVLMLAVSVTAVAIEPRHRCKEDEAANNNAVAGSRTGGNNGNGRGRGGAGNNAPVQPSAAGVAPPVATGATGLDNGNNSNNGDDNVDNGNANNGNNDGTNNGGTNGINNGNNGGTNNGGAGNGTGDNTSDAADGQTLVLFEINGVPGNECLTFRNNGEIVDAACVNTAADRQLTPSTLNGQSILRVQRTFTAGFRPDLVGVDVCVGFNGTAFRAEDCAAQGVELVSFTGGELRTQGGACASGHDGAAQVTVDETGAVCARFTTTVVQPAAVQK